MVVRQQEVDSLLSAGKSPHLRLKIRNFHECKFVNNNSRDEDGFGKPSRKAPTNMSINEGKSFFSSNAPYAN